VCGDYFKQFRAPFQSVQICPAYSATLNLNRAKVCSVEPLSLSKVAGYSAQIHNRRVQDYLDKVPSSSLSSSLVVYSGGLGKVHSNSLNKVAGCLAIHNRKAQGYLGRILSSSLSSKATVCLEVADLGKVLLSKAVGCLVEAVSELLSDNLSSSSKAAAYLVQARVHNSYRISGKRKNNNSNNNHRHQLYNLDKVNKGRNLAFHRLLLPCGWKGEA
jgi:hypothetical protein